MNSGGNKHRNSYYKDKGYSKQGGGNNWAPPHQQWQPIDDDSVHYNNNQP